MSEPDYSQLQQIVEIFLLEFNKQNKTTYRWVKDKSYLAKSSERKWADAVVYNKQGKELEFVVELVEQYKDAQFPISEVFSSSDGEKRLNLITCAGTFSQLSRRYSDRLVVFTVLKEIAEG